jgi:hypothetical protein
MSGAMNEALDAPAEAHTPGAGAGDAEDAVAGLPACVAVLDHPNGARVYLVGTAHVSPEAAREAREVVERVAPAAVVLELDAGRLHRLLEAAAEGDEFGTARVKKGGWTLARMALTGEILPYAAGLGYAALGAVMGARPGGEFVEAADAAARSGAMVIAGDRDQGVTLARLAWYTRALAAARRGPNGGLLPGAADDASGWPRPPGADAGPAAELSQLLRRERAGDPGGAAARAEAEAEARAAGRRPGDPWGLGAEAGGEADDATPAAVERRLVRMMSAGGCPAPEATLAAAKRLFEAGLTGKGARDAGAAAPLDVVDLLAVRSCGRAMVEKFRKAALAGDAGWLQAAEAEALAGAHGAAGAAGAARSAAAMEKVIVDERDVILTRALWLAAEEAGPSPVVGVVGAGHVAGIRRLWPRGGDAALAARAREYAQLPPGAGPPGALSAAATAGALGFIAWRRPRAAAAFAGLVTLATAPYLGFAVVSMKRFGAFTERLAATARAVDQGMAGDGGGGGEGWPAAGPGEWQ